MVESSTAQRVSFRFGRGEKLLGQVVPAADVDTDLYTAPTGFVGVVTTIVICNTAAGGSLAYRVHHNDSGGAAAVGNALYYGPTLAGASTLLIGGETDVGFAVTAGGKIIVRTVAGTTLTFSAYGYEMGTS